MKKTAVKIEPSILSADFAHLADEVKRAERSGADALHIDIMDGHFVRNLTMGAQIVSAVKRSTHLFLDVHFMLYTPFDYVESFVKAGADSITIHIEATEEVEETLKFIRRCGIKAGLAICPETSASLILNYLTQCDLVLLMTVQPGFGGQKFMPEVLEKIQFVRDVCNRLNIRQGGVVPSNEEQKKNMPPFDIQVDGGINPETAKLCAEAGANVFVSGNYLFHAADMASAIEQLKVG